MTALADLFLNSTGRIGRIRFLAGAACLIGAWVAVDIFLRTPGWLHALVAAALLYGGFCILSQRLHDRGRSGWWSGPILLAFALVWPQPLTLLGWVSTAALVLIAFDLAVLPGQKAFNRYGAARQSGATPG
ncbi:DUF805 domain-containing protein [Brevundimonas diminuta]|uniref:DUF805 domain-containing protein n=1 Tax=Brevundimonas diminuta TaxID=293 RepID=UPI000207EF7B|nr:DUF805 domain-containing protein [Brevundimonas diminuta]EGF93961.1 hypothetical protein BDIM_07700 [Brevundimonas diminuta ATCC 11568]OWR17867.1 DUF805 domain-containing protein [Brevundimonas diminuta]WQE44098.1 DUF805 domain-containing protein [Brevundimonas diminuta]SUW16594.1 Predicted membrane protein [Brevundimonas diminuta]